MGVFAITCFGDSRAIRKTKGRRIRIKDPKAKEEFPYGRSSQSGSTRLLATAPGGLWCHCQPRQNFRLSSLRIRVHRQFVGVLPHLRREASRPPMPPAPSIFPAGPNSSPSVSDLDSPCPRWQRFCSGCCAWLEPLAVSVCFSPRTALDWQAIQLWRIEWLLGAVAAFVAGCLLKK